MGLNSCHSAPKDYVPCVNKRTGKVFKAQVRTRNIEKMSIVQNIDYVACQCVLVINGHVDLMNEDMIHVPFFKDDLKVEAIQPIESNDILFKHRKDYENFQSSIQVALS